MIFDHAKVSYLKVSLVYRGVVYRGGGGVIPKKHKMGILIMFRMRKLVLVAPSTLSKVS